VTASLNLIWMVGIPTTFWCENASEQWLDLMVLDLKSINLPLSVLTALFSLIAPETAEADPMQCIDRSFVVDSNDPEMTDHLCAMATEVRGKLEACGLTQSRPLTIEMVDKVSHPMGDCLAYFDCEYDLVRVTDPASYKDLMGEDASYASLPVMVTLRALLTHEITHAFLTQAAGDRPVPMVDQEYAAAAMELEFMEEKWRKALINANPVSFPPREGLIDIWIYAFSPRKFAVNAWQHFSLAENGCSLIRKIVGGQKSFYKEVRPELQ